MKSRLAAIVLLGAGLVAVPAHAANPTISNMTTERVMTGGVVPAVTARVTFTMTHPTCRDLRADIHVQLAGVVQPTYERTIYGYGTKSFTWSVLDYAGEYAPGLYRFRVWVSDWFGPGCSAEGITNQIGDFFIAG